ncbi:MAG: hypothetical protein ACI9VR_001281 [Cognaticolwellia sp.]|jgi:hypothetical protein
MGFLDSRSQSVPRPWRVGLPIAVGLVFCVLYTLSLASGPAPDGAAFLEMAQGGHWLHAQHLIAGLPLHGLLVAFPEHDPARLSGLLSAACGGLAVGALCSLGLGMGLGRGGAALGAAIVGLTQGWWTHGTAYEVHILAVGVTLLAAALAVTGKRHLQLGLLLAVAVLCHKTMLLAVPGLMLTSLVGLKRPGLAALRTLAVLTVILGAAYGLAAFSQLDTGRSMEQIGRELALGELRDGADRPLNDQIAMRARHALAYTVTQLPDKGQVREILTWVVPGLLILPALLGSAVHWRLRPQHRRALLLWLWPLLALPAIWAFEAGNFEYYLGPVAVLVMLGCASLPERFSWALLLPLAALGGQHYQADVVIERLHDLQPRREGPARNPSAR